jgi:uncharacterized protein YdiU (UPF0061 family)
MSQSGWNFEHTYTDLPDIFFQQVKPTPAAQPKLLVWNAPLAQELGLNCEPPADAALVFAGNLIPEGARPLAQAYAGHQFGNFTMLGDGRALLLGEQVTPSSKRFDIQLKGSGRTPFSRRGDGRAALGPMLREYIISEAMHALGIPTTRSLAVVSTGETVMRDRPLPGAVLTRVAASHIRVGTFEYAAAHGDPADIAALTLYTLERHFPDFPEDAPPALSLLQNVVQRQAQLIARWMHVGFIHGVMNTDNMALSGETIDYGPCAFLDSYHPQTVFSSIDEQGRYAYANQARIGLWNLERFAATLLPILHDDEDAAIEMAQDVLESFAEIYNSTWLNGMYRKIGLSSDALSGEGSSAMNGPAAGGSAMNGPSAGGATQSREGDQKLVTDLMALLQKADCDYTNTFRALPLLLEPSEADSHATAELDKLRSQPNFSNWYEAWTARLKLQNYATAQAIELMNRSNPNVIARNHQVERALREAEVSGDLTRLQRLVSGLQRPFDNLPEHQEFRAAPQVHERVVATFCGT